MNQRCDLWPPLLHHEHLLHFVSKMIDDLDADAAMFRLRKRPRDCRVQFLPGGLVDLGLEGTFKPIIRIVPDEICGFAFAPEVDDTRLNFGRLTVLKARMNQDLRMVISRDPRAKG